MNKIINSFINLLKAFFILFILCVVNPLRAQNLVPDPGFEMYYRCPDSLGNLCWLPSCFIQPDAVHWFDPNRMSSDYFNTCGTFQCGIPQNDVGYQYPRTGNGYGGFSTANDVNNFASEYVATRLTKPMEAGKNYCVSFWVSLADTVCLASNRLGAFFSADSAYYSSVGIFATPQINPKLLVTSKTEWIQITGEFTANGDEKFLIIGTFDTTGYDTINVECEDLSFYIPYYYIDDVEVYETDYCNWNDTLVANIFTPNGDGLNDSWRMDFKNSTDYLEIYNRWGQQIARTDKNNPGWDGTQNGHTCAPGIYYYAGIYRNKPRKGFVQLVR